MTDLLSQIRDATEGSRELDIAIAEHVIGKGWASESDIPHYTTNLQDAVSLVPDGWWVDGLESHPDLGWRCILWASYPVRRADSSTDENERNIGWKPTPALALCIAIIKAHESKADAERKQWCENMARLEGDAEIGAGLIARDPE